MDKMPLVGIPPNDLGKYWHFLREPLDMVLKERTFGETLVDDLLVGGIHGFFQFWVLGQLQAIVVTKITDYPRLRACRVVIVTGKGFDEHYTDVMDVLVPWAKSQGCARIEQGGRKGWLRKLEPLGWKPSYVEMFLEV